MGTLTVDIPKPTPKAGEGLIKVRACAINNTEKYGCEKGLMKLERSQDVARKASKFPRIPGSNITGEVVDLGDRVDQWYASTQICSSCGERGQKKAIDVREWTCACGAHHDRDINASVNLLRLAN